MTAHWGVEDSAAFEGPVDEQRSLFQRVCVALEQRIELFAKLSPESLDRVSLESRLDEIGKSKARLANET